ncbi:MAG: anhydro-N-acetylmuramic acid kinase [Burkholderiaceae bacterium]|nr:anhydro-N-acetylmuramic acid kinase [Burkholderiaceae bacterium]
MYIGLMSGTSLDGVDGVLAAIPDDYAGGRLTMPAMAHVPFPPELRTDLLALQAPGHNEIEREALASQTLARLYADCVAQLLAQAGVPRERVRAIGVHGQTVRHRPELGFTRQINQPALLAELAGIDVIADFRSRDIAAGGQGAPLVPAFHQAVFGQAGKTRVVVNIGGIANISLLRHDGHVTGFDTGPGNVLLDGWIARHRDLPYDADGAWAASGQCCAQLLERMLAEPYLALPPPKSTGRDLFHLDWLAARLAESVASAGLAPQDVQATLADFTAETIAQAIGQHAPGAAAVYVCGGGAYSRHLMQQLSLALRQHCPQATLDTTAALGIAPNQVEALAFAWLAQRFCLRQPGNLPAVTGARGARILGALYPA